MSPDDFGLDFFEKTVIEGFWLCLMVESGFSGANYRIDSFVLKTFCKKSGLDFLWCFALAKAMISEMRKED